MTIKRHSTGHNDSIEDVFIAVANIKTLDGKIVHKDVAWEAVLDAKDELDEIEIGDDE
jgi:hypothetical protein